MPNDVELIKSRLDVVDVIGEYVRLKQSGQNWKGLCPFHGEKTPSFMVHREKQIWHCFGCGLGGDIFEFVEKIENIEFPEALELLARKAGVELSRAPQGQPASKRARLFRSLEEATKFYQQQLKTSVGGSEATKYLAKRDLNQESQSTFALGYAPAEWDKLFVYLRNQGFTPEELIQAGLILKSERGPGFYDRFRDRLMFPIADAQGRTVGFGGRTLDPEAKEAPSASSGQAKYINSPQGPVYNKSLILYNLDKAKEHIRAVGYALLVEGYMDVIGVWQAGVKNLVATSGTALTAEQVKLLKRYTNEIRLTFDIDVAGEAATWRGIDEALAAELEVKVVSLPQGKDPDEAVRADAAGFRQAVDKAEPFGDFMVRLALKRFDPATREGKKRGVDFLVEVFDRFPNPVEKDYYYKIIAREFDVEERYIRERQPKVARVISPKQAEPIPVVDRPSREQMLSERLLALLLTFGDNLWSLTAELEPAMLTQELTELYRLGRLQYTERQRVDINELKNELANEPTINRLIDVLVLRAEHDFADFSPAQAEQEFNNVSRELKLNYLKKELKLLSDAIHQAEVKKQVREVEELALRYREVTSQIARWQV